MRANNPGPHVIQEVACQSLTTFGLDPTGLGEFLLRISLSSDSVYATALLPSLLAFSSLRKYGLHLHALELKTSALGALAARATKDLDPTEAVHHIATMMLLYSFEAS